MFRCRGTFVGHQVGKFSSVIIVMSLQATMLETTCKQFFDTKTTQFSAFFIYMCFYHGCWTFIWINSFICFIGFQGPVWCLTEYGEFLFSGSSDKTIKVILFNLLSCACRRQHKISTLTLWVLFIKIFLLNSLRCFLKAIKYWVWMIPWCCRFGTQAIITDVWRRWRDTLVLYWPYVPGGTNYTVAHRTVG